MLVNSRVGAGPTKLLVSILDQHFADDRQKLPTLPTAATVENLYGDLMQRPSSEVHAEPRQQGTQARNSSMFVVGACMARGAAARTRCMQPLPSPNNNIPRESVR